MGREDVDLFQIALREVPDGTGTIRVRILPDGDDESAFEFDADVVHATTPYHHIDAVKHTQTATPHTDVTVGVAKIAFLVGVSVGMIGTAIMAVAIR